MKNFWTVCLFLFLSVNQYQGGNAACDSLNNVANLIASVTSHFRGKTDELKKCIQPRVLFYEFMTPEALVKYQDFIQEPHSVTENELHFPKGSPEYSRLLRIPLVPACVLSKDTPVTIHIEVGNNRELGRKQDTDISFGISDGKNFMGIETRDKAAAPYKTQAPCGANQGESANVMGNQDYPGDSSDPWAGTQTADYPAQFGITLKPNREGSSCSILDNNVWKTRPQTFSVKLCPENGLSLEVYKNQRPEEYGIEYIAVQVIRDD